MDQWPSQVISGDNITLRCSFVPEDDYALANIEVAWQFFSKSHWTIVYHYVNGAAQLEDQDRRFHGRAWIVPEELNEKKASLKISSVRLTDTGEYRCIVVDNGGAATHTTYLTVLAPYSSPRLTAIYGNGTVILHCLSEGGYPQGEVMWHDGSGEQLSQSWSREYISNRFGGVDINSTVSVPLKEFSVVCCSVIHTALQQNRTACEEIKGETLH
ncbi:CD276 antigen-like [Protopterus annectens]|uniref:CD276 antigen-like n=1 Tax=Protopterus annectens TaxID=7888 RepID=UPI001CF9D608|nr:CD276 antigen-like [Protopterus annectens]